MCVNGGGGGVIRIVRDVLLEISFNIVPKNDVKVEVRVIKDLTDLSTCI